MADDVLAGDFMPEIEPVARVKRMRRKQLLHEWLSCAQKPIKSARLADSEGEPKSINAFDRCYDSKGMLPRQDPLEGFAI